VKTIRRYVKSSLTFFIQYGVAVGTLGNEKDKEEEYLGGST